MHLFFKSAPPSSLGFLHLMPPGGNVPLCSSDVKPKLTVAPLIILIQFHRLETSLFAAHVNSPLREVLCVCECITVIITCNFKWLCAQLQQPPEAAAQTMSSDMFEQISFKWIQKVCLLHLKPSTVGSWLQPNIQTRQSAPATQGADSRLLTEGEPPEPVEAWKKHWADFGRTATNNPPGRQDRMFLLTGCL